MSASPSLAPPLRPGLVIVCRRCGGSGILRLADGRFRTCLDCLGQGTALAAIAEESGTAEGSTHSRSLRAPNEEGCRADNRGQGSGGQQQENDGGPVCVHSCD
jgi:hypothetical protein